MYSDKELVDKVLKGNQAAFSILVKKYERLVYHIVNRIVLDNEVTKDVCQEVFIKVYQKLEDFKFNAKLSTWIATIAYRKALNHIKMAKSKKPVNVDELVGFEPASELLTPQQALEATDTIDYVHKLLECLPIQYKVVLTLYHLNEFNYKEIYEITGWPEGTVKNYLFRARNLLKDLIKKNSAEVNVN